MNWQEVLEEKLDSNPRFTYGVLIELLFGDIEHLNENISQSDRKALLDGVKELRKMQ